ncbi:MAG: flavodoxin [Methanosphaera sp.]|nr:flavodoxin [Methanosphaera sp.]
MDLVVYYSRTNNTREVSEIIAEENDAKLVEIKDKKSRSGALGYALGAVDSVIGKKTSISYEKVNLSEYDTIYIGTPVWASKPAPAVLQFIDENDFNGVNVITFATMMSSGGNKTVNAMNDKISAKGGIVKRSFSLALKGNDTKQLVMDALSEE